MLFFIAGMYVMSSAAISYLNTSHVILYQTAIRAASEAVRYLNTSHVILYRNFYSGNM